VAFKCLTRQLQTDGRPGIDSGFVSFLTTIILLRNIHTLLPDRRVDGVICRGQSNRALKLVVSVQAALRIDAEVTSRLVLHSRFYKIHLCVKEKQLNRQMASLSPRVPRRRDGCVKFDASVIRRSQHMHMFCRDTKHGRHVATDLLCLFKR